MEEDSEARGPGPRRGGGRAGGGIRGILTGLVLAALLVPWRSSAAAPPGEPWCWVADREGNRVVLLDRFLVPRAVHPIESPRRLAPAAGGGVWVLGAGPAGGVGPSPLSSGSRVDEGPSQEERAGEGATRGEGTGEEAIRAGEEELEPTGPGDTVGREPRGDGGRWPQLVRLTEEGTVEPFRDVLGGPVVDMAARGDGSLVLLVAESSEVHGLWRFDSPGRARRLGELGPADWLVASGEHVLVGTSGECLRVWDTGARPALIGRAEAAVLAAVARSGRGGWWTLEGSAEERRLVLRRGDLEVLWAERLGGREPARRMRLVSVPGGGLWIATESPGRLERRAPDGTRLVTRELSPDAGLGFLRVVGDELVLVYPGGLLRADLRGEIRGAQGGFDGLVDLVPVGG